MKVNLLLNGRDVRAGYLNVDPLAQPGDGKVFGCLADLDPLVEDAEAAEVVALDVLDFLPAADSGAAVRHWARKLGHGGTLAVGGLDLREVGRRLHSFRLDLDAANRLIYGDQRAPWQYRKGAYSQATIAGLLESLGLVVRAKSYRDCFYTVTARRP